MSVVVSVVVRSCRQWGVPPPGRRNGEETLRDTTEHHAITSEAHLACGSTGLEEHRRKQACNVEQNANSCPSKMTYAQKSRPRFTRMKIER